MRDIPKRVYIGSEEIEYISVDYLRSAEMRKRIARAIDLLNFEATPRFMTFVPEQEETLFYQADRIIAAILTPPTPAESNDDA